MGLLDKENSLDDVHDVHIDESKVTQNIKDTMKKRILSNFALWEIKDTGNAWLLLKEWIDFAFEQTSELRKIGSKEQYCLYLDAIFPSSKIKKVLYHGTNLGQKRIPVLNIMYGKKLENFSETERNNYVNNDRKHKNANEGGFYFSPTLQKKLLVDMQESSFRIHWDGAANYGKHIYPVIVDFRNPLNSNSVAGLTEDKKNAIKARGYDSAMFDVNHSDVVDGEKSDPDSQSIVEYIAFDPNQIHVLGSKSDVAWFKAFVSSLKS